MKSVYNLIIVLLSAAVLVLLFLQIKGSGSNEELEKSYNEDLDSLNELYIKTENQNDFLKDNNDSLGSALLQLMNIQDKNGTTSRDVDTPEEKEIRALVTNLNKGWQDLVAEHDADAVLQYFLEEFTTNEVKINTENLPFVRKHNNTNYREHVAAIAEIKDLKIDMGKIKMYSIFVREKIFATQFLTEITVEHKGKVVMESTILSLVSGEKDDGIWKVGNYSWIRFEHFDIL